MRVRHALLGLACGTVQPAQAQRPSVTVESRLRPTARQVQRALRRVPGSTRYGLTIAAEPEFVWYRVAKVGSRSLVDAFHRSDVRFVADHPYGIVVPRFAIKNFFTFTFVRDPRTRLVSAWQDKVVRSNAFGLPSDVHADLKHFDRFVDWVASQDLGRCDGHLRLQVASVDLGHLDFVGRFESFQRDFEQLRTELALRPVDLPHKNASRAAQEVYTPRLLRRVEDLYRDDLVAFGY